MHCWSGMYVGWGKRSSIKDSITILNSMIFGLRFKITLCFLIYELTLVYENKLSEVHKSTTSF